MATYEVRQGSTLGLNADGLDRVSILRRRVDIGALNDGAGVALSDVINVFNLPKGYMALRGFIEVVTAGTGVGTLDLSNSLAPATGVGSTTIAAGTAQHVATADAVITSTVGGAAGATITAGVVEFGLVVVQLSQQAADR